MCHQGYLGRNELIEVKQEKKDGRFKGISRFSY